MRRRFALAASVCLALLLPRLEFAAQNHPQQIEVNGKSYQWPRTPVVVILIDGGDPAYVHAGLSQGVLPNFKRLMTEGFASIAVVVMPSFNYTNNISCISGLA